MRFVFSVIYSLVVAASSAAAAAADIRADVEALFRLDPPRFDFARIKLETDRLIDPSIDVDARLAEVEHMAATIATANPPDASAWDRLGALRQFLYEPGSWNRNHPFAYDHDDPYGDEVTNKLLSDYLDDRRGNCVTMPFLVTILGQRLGLDMTPAMAPLHVFVKFTDDEGKTWNLEATSGAGAARDQHYRDHLPITDAALENGVFLTPLSREESIAVIASVVVEDLIARERYLDAMAVADILLEHYPNYAYIMVKKATAAYYLLKAEFHDKYGTADDVPKDHRAYLAYR